MTSDRVPNKSAVQSPQRCTVRYEDLDKPTEPIGQGGQAVVYEILLGPEYPIDRVAFKEPHLADTLTSDAIDGFLEEAATWATLDRREREKPRWTDSEHIVGVIDTGEQFPWIAMEYMDGGSLADRLDATEDGLPIDEALWIGECLCRGLAVAHSYGVAHLDLKPANVLFRETAEDNWNLPKLGDWGLARVLANRTGSMENLSVSYAAPEQFAPEEFGKQDTLTDVYQLGTVLYVMFTGELPYKGTRLNVMHNVTSKERPSLPSDHRSSVSEAIDSTVLRALEPHKTDRYESIFELKRALRAIRLDERLPRIVERNYKYVRDNQYSGETITAPESKKSESNKSLSRPGPDGDFSEEFNLYEQLLREGSDSTISIPSLDPEWTTKEKSSDDSHSRASPEFHQMTPQEVLSGTDIFVRYKSSGISLECALSDNYHRDEVAESLNLERNTRFDVDTVKVGSQFFGQFLESTLEYRFVGWIVSTLPFEIRDTGHEKSLKDLYEALPVIDWVDLKGTVHVEYTEDGQKTRSQELFDIVFRNRMGEPLIVANVNDSQEGATQSMMEDLVHAAERVGQSSDAFAGAFLVTNSFFEPPALETADDATKGGLLSRGKRKSFVNLSRKNGYHLCLVGDMNGQLSLMVPELD